MNEVEPSKISVLKAILCVAIALIADAISLIPYVNIVNGFVFWFSFTVYFWSKGVKKLGPNTVAAVVEVIPILSMLPAITLGVVVTIGMQWRHEKKEAKKKADEENKNAQKNKRGPQQNRTPARTPVQK